MKRSKSHARSPKSIVPHSILGYAAVAFGAIAFVCTLYYAGLLPLSLNPTIDSTEVEISLRRILRSAAMEDNTVIVTTLNEAWALPGSVLDLFLQSFRIGDGTATLLKHLVIVAMDEIAHSRCEQLHDHCFLLQSEGLNSSREAFFMSPEYLNMMWTRIDFLRRVLEMGFNFVFSVIIPLTETLIPNLQSPIARVFQDVDVMWLRNPFPHFNEEADFQSACDRYGKNTFNGSILNGGFNYVRSNERSIRFYRYWGASRERFPGEHDQTVLNMIKNEVVGEGIGLKMRLLNTEYFGGFCEPSRNLNLVCTMHANCCVGMESKLNDLQILLNDWKYYRSFPPNVRKSSMFYWRVPQKCNLDFLHELNVTRIT